MRSNSSPFAVSISTGVRMRFLISRRTSKPFLSGNITSSTISSWLPSIALLIPSLPVWTANSVKPSGSRYVVTKWHKSRSSSTIRRRGLALSVNPGVLGTVHLCESRNGSDPSYRRHSIQPNVNRRTLQILTRSRAFLTSQAIHSRQNKGDGGIYETRHHVDPESDCLDCVVPIDSNRHPPRVTVRRFCNKRPKGIKRWPLQLRIILSQMTRGAKDVIS